MSGSSTYSGSSPATVNYTFTDSDLQSLLTSLDQGAVVDELLGADPGSQSLQFLPHLSSPHGSPEPAPAVFVPADLTLSQLDGILLPLPLLPSATQCSMSPTARRQPDRPQRGQEQQQHARAPPRQVRAQGQRAGGAAAASLPAPARPGGAKPPHSLVEKQRRDRINSLIDEVRWVQGRAGGRAARRRACNSRAPVH